MRGSGQIPAPMLAVMGQEFGPPPPPQPKGPGWRMSLEAEIARQEALSDLRREESNPGAGRRWDLWGVK